MLCYTRADFRRACHTNFVDRMEKYGNMFLQIIARNIKKEDRNEQIV